MRKLTRLVALAIFALSLVSLRGTAWTDLGTGADTTDNPGGVSWE